MNIDLTKILSGKSSRRKANYVLALIKPTRAQMLTLLAIYYRVVQLWIDATPAIAASYEVDLSAKDGPGTGGAAKAEIGRTSAQASSLILLLVPVAAAWASRLEKVQQARWVQAVLSATKVDLTGIIGPSDMAAILKASADWNAALVRDVSGEIEARISNAVFTGFQSHTSVYETAKEINKTTGIARRRARNIAVDQSNKLMAALNRARREQAGIGEYQWVHSAKLRARPTHLARNGMIFKNDDPRIAPNDRCGVPPMCGCFERAVISP